MPAPTTTTRSWRSSFSTRSFHHNEIGHSEPTAPRPVPGPQGRTEGHRSRSAVPLTAGPRSDHNGRHGGRFGPPATLPNGDLMTKNGPAVVVGGASGIGAAVVERLRERGDRRRRVGRRRAPRHPPATSPTPTRSPGRRRPPSSASGSLPPSRCAPGIGHGRLAGRRRAGRVGPGDGRERQGCMAGHAGLRRRHVSGGGRIHRRHQQRELATGRPVHGPLLRVESRARHGCASGRGRVGPAPAGQCRRPRGDRHTHAGPARPVRAPGSRVSGRRTALGRIGRPGDVAETVLAVHRLPWVTGQVIDCDGGLSLFSPIDPTGAGSPVPSPPTG